MKHLAGGAALIILALLVGLLHNAIRSDKMELIPSIALAQAISTNTPAESTGTAAEDTTVVDSEMNSTSAEGKAAEAVRGVVPLEKAKALHDSGTAVFMDAREEEAYNDGHIPGAMNVPYDKLPKYYETITSTIANDQIIICYCWGPTCDFSDNLASELAMMGYKNVVVFKGGWDAWQEAGYPIERLKTQSN